MFLSKFSWLKLQVRFFCHKSTTQHWALCPKQARSQVLVFAGKCLYHMFKTDFSEHNETLGHITNLGWLSYFPRGYRSQEALLTPHAIEHTTILHLIINNNIEGRRDEFNVSSLLWNNQIRSYARCTSKWPRFLSFRSMWQPNTAIASHERSAKFCVARMYVGQVSELSSTTLHRIQWCNWIGRLQQIFV